MRIGALLVIVACVVVALATSGAHPLTSSATDALTAFGEVTTRRQLDLHLGPDTFEHVAEVARDPSADFGMRLRAIGALPLFCVPRPCAGTPPHLVARDLLARDPVSTDGRQVLRVRAAVEAIGLMRSGALDDAAAVSSLLNDPSRDVRAAAAHALANLCDTTALPALRARYTSEQVDQVRVAISNALRTFDTCVGP